MHKWIIAFFLLFCINALAASTQETYYNSCYETYSKALTAFSKLTPDKIKTESKEMCTLAKERWDSEKKWPSIRRPAYLGCLNAFDLLYSEDAPNRKEKVAALQRDVCKSL